MKKVCMLIVMVFTLMGTVAALAESVPVPDTTIAENTNERVIRGVINVPEFFVGKVEVYIEGFYSETETEKIIITAPGKYPYELPVDRYTDEEYPILRFSSGYEHEGNCYIGSLYYTKNGSTYNSDYAEGVILDDGVIQGINFDFIKGKSILGDISLQEGGYIKTGSVGIIITCYNSDFYNEFETKMSSEQKVQYKLSIPDEVDGCYCDIYTFLGDGCDTNLLSGEYYFSEDGITDDWEKGSWLHIESDTNYNVKLPIYDNALQIRVQLPEDAQGDLIGAYVYIENVETGEEIYRWADWDQNGCFKLPVSDAGSYIVLLEPEVYGETNILIDAYYYVSDTETTNSYNEASSIYIEGENNFIVINMKTRRTISGSIIVPEGINVNELEDKVEISIKTEGYNSIKKAIVLTGKETLFEIEIEEDYAGSIEISYVYNGDEPLLYKGQLYYTEKGMMLNIENEEAIVLAKGEKMNGVKIELIKNKAKFDILAKRSDKSDSKEYVSRSLYFYTDTDEPTYISAIKIGQNQEATITLSIPDSVEYRDDDFFLLGLEKSGWSGLEYKDRYVTDDGQGTFDEEKAAKYDWNTTQIELIAEDISTITKDAVKNKLLTFSSNESRISDDALTIYAEPSAFEKMGRYLLEAMCCEYDEEGCLINVRRGEIYGYFGGLSGTLFLDFEYNEKHAYKVFLWDAEGTFMPMAEVFEIKYAQ